MHETYNRMMESVKLTPAARSSIEEKLTAAATKPKTPFRPVKIAAAVACACLVLTGTCLAANYLSKRVDLGSQRVSTEESSYKVMTALTPRSTDTFSEAFQTDLESGTLQRTHNDKALLEDYLGVRLIDAPALEETIIVEDLEESIKYKWNLRPELKLDPDARYVISLTDAEGNFVESDPDIVKVTAHRVLYNTELYIDARIITEHMTMEALKEGLLGENFEPVNLLKHEWILDENGMIKLDADGNPMAITTPYQSAEHNFESSTYQMANGCEATIVCATMIESDGTGSFREYIGYFVSDNILYSVKPYAIYDPSLSFPMHDSDSLIVLKDVLDCFK